MNCYYLENDCLKVTVSDHGAELISVFGKKLGREYIWNADPAYWNRHAPVLFPFVGSVKNKVYTYGQKEWPMNQHGFARDMNFSLLCRGENSLWFRLKATEETKKIYPFDFILDIGYELEGNSLKVNWIVTNPQDGTLYFSIGAHPAFMCPINPGEKQTDCSLDFHTDKEISYNLIKESGLVGIYDEILPVNHGKIGIDEHLFDRDALIIEGGQSKCVSLLDGSGMPYVTVDFEAPLFGVWSPAQKRAPFICIEPWYGRCDSVEFSGTLKDRDYQQILEGRQTFEADYVIRFDQEA